jgi:hypothetical protein
MSSSSSLESTPDNSNNAFNDQHKFPSKAKSQSSRYDERYTTATQVLRLRKSETTPAANYQIERRCAQVVYYLVQQLPSGQFMSTKNISAILGDCSGIHGLGEGQHLHKKRGLFRVSRLPPLMPHQNPPAPKDPKSGKLQRATRRPLQESQDAAKHAEAHESTPKVS